MEVKIDYTDISPENLDLIIKGIKEEEGDKCDLSYVKKLDHMVVSTQIPGNLISLGLGMAVFFDAEQSKEELQEFILRGYSEESVQRCIEYTNEELQKLYPELPKNPLSYEILEDGIKIISTTSEAFFFLGAGITMEFIAENMSKFK